MSALDHARDLTRRGWAVLPVAPGEKGPKGLKGWPDLRLAEDDLPRYFNGKPQNVAVLNGEPSGWRVDVDLDHPRAVALADEYLPATACAWGRDSKPASHRCYQLTAPADNETWKSATAGMIAELRCRRLTSLAPGSVHPSGEAVRWDSDGEPAEIDPETLIAAIDAMAGTIREELGEPDQPQQAPEPPRRPVNCEDATPRARAALAGEAANSAAAVEGCRNETLNRSAFKLGTLIGAGEIDRAEVEAELLSAARDCGLTDHEAKPTIRSGIEAGIQHPRPREPRARSVRMNHKRPDDADDHQQADHEPQVAEPEPEADPEVEPWQEPEGVPEEPEAQPRLIVRKASTIAPEEQVWTWYRRIPRRAFSLIAGVQGLGKSFTTLDMAARISAGRPWPDTYGDDYIEPASVLLLNLEDDPATTTIPRLIAMGADLERVHIIDGVGEVGEDGVRAFDATRDCRHMARYIEQTGERFALVILDPVASCIGDRKQNDNAEVRAALHKLGEFARSHDCAVVGIAHLRKADSEEALFRVAGSIAWTAYARAVWLIMADDASPDDRLFLSGKLNVAKPAAGLRFSIGGEGALAWSGDEVRQTASEAMAERRRGGREPSEKVKAAMEWLEEQLAGGVEQPAKPIEEAATDRGFTAHQLRAARNELGIESRKGKGFQEGWYWTLPATDTGPRP